jgi:hypothetical protein
MPGWFERRFRPSSGNIPSNVGVDADLGVSHEVAEPNNFAKIYIPRVVESGSRLFGSWDDKGWEQWISRNHWDFQKRGVIHPAIRTVIGAAGTGKTTYLEHIKHLARPNAMVMRIDLRDVTPNFEDEEGVPYFSAVDFQAYGWSTNKSYREEEMRSYKNRIGVENSEKEAQENFLGLRSFLISNKAEILRSLNKLYKGDKVSISGAFQRLVSYPYRQLPYVFTDIRAQMPIVFLVDNYDDSSVETKTRDRGLALLSYLVDYVNGGVVLATTEIDSSSYIPADFDEGGYTHRLGGQVFQIGGMRKYYMFVTEMLSGHDEKGMLVPIDYDEDPDYRTKLIRATLGGRVMLDQQNLSLTGNPSVDKEIIRKAVDAPNGQLNRAQYREIVEKYLNDSLEIYGLGIKKIRELVNILDVVLTQEGDSAFTESVMKCIHFQRSYDADLRPQHPELPDHTSMRRLIELLFEVGIIRRETGKGYSIDPGCGELIRWSRQ